MFAAKRERPYIRQTVVVLSTRVKEPNETNYQKLARMIKYLNGTKKNCLTLSVDNLKVIKWYMETRFVVRPYFNSRTEAIITTG